MHYKHGDIVLVDLEKEAGSQSSDLLAPALVVSSDTVNEHLPTVIVCPILEAKNVWESRVGATLLPKEVSEFNENALIVSLHLKSISKRRIGRRVGVLPPEYMKQVRESLQAVLNLD